jgi:PAS domain S-box-containing protein
MIRLTFFGSPVSLAAGVFQAKPLNLQPKRIGLLAYLACAQEGTLTAREELLEMFWPDDRPENARSSLRTALHAIRREIGEKYLLRQGNSAIGLERKNVASDVADFRKTIEGGAFAEALTLFKGDFLAGLHIDGASEFQSWLERQRSEHRELAAAAALRLAGDEFSRNNYPGIVFWLRRAEGFLGRDEEISALLMAVLANMGNVPAALHEYTELTYWLRADLDAEPSAETRALEKLIRNGSTPPLEKLFGTRSGSGGTQRADLRQSRTEYVGRGGIHTQHFRDLVELADDVIYRADLFGFIVYTNPAGIRLLGLPQDKIIGRLFADFIREDFRVHAIEFYLRQLHENTESTYFEFPVVRDDGETRWIGQRVQLVRNEGTVIGIQAIARDITASRLAQEIKVRPRPSVSDSTQTD